MRDPASQPGSDQAGSQPDNPSSEHEQASSTPSGPSSAHNTLKLLAEELAVERRRVETGRVRVEVVTREHQELVDVPLAREEVVLERVPIDRVVDTIPSVRQDGDTIIVPVVEETFVVERRLRLKEELHVKRIRTTEQHRENVTLRRQEAVVSRTRDEAPDVETHPAVATKVESK